MAQDYYKTLEVSRTATPDEIQKAYRTLARKYHPDLNPDDKQAKQKFQEVQAAFDVLNDVEKRKLYDRYGANFEAAGAAGPQGGTYNWNPQGGDVEFDVGDLFGGGGVGGGGGFADIFRQFRRGGGGGRERAAPTSEPARGADIEHSITIPFTTAILGGGAHISVRRATGKVEDIDVKIPDGIEDGKKIRLRGQGEAAPSRGKRGTAGDILLTVHVSPHPCYRRRGQHLDVVVPVSLAEAALGAKIDLPTPKGDIRLSIPPGTSSGKKLRVKGHGVATAGKPAGDLFAEIQIVLPEGLDEEDRGAIEKIAAKHPSHPRNELRW